MAIAALLSTAGPASAAGTRDVTADVLADREVTLTGDTVVTVPSGTTTYDGVFRGEGTLTVRGDGTLVLTRDSDFTLPRSRQRQVVRTPGGDGNDVVLSAVSSPGHSPAVRSGGPSDASVVSRPRPANTASSGLGWWPYTLAVGLLMGLVLPAVQGRGGRRTGGMRRRIRRAQAAGRRSHRSRPSRSPRLLAA